MAIYRSDLSNGFISQIVEIIHFINQQVITNLIFLIAKYWFERITKTMIVLTNYSDFRIVYDRRVEFGFKCL